MRERFERLASGAAKRPVLTLGISGLGVLYYVVLGRADLSWKLAQQASKHELTLWPLLLAIAPLAIPAVLAWRPRPVTMLAIINRVWVPAGRTVKARTSGGDGQQNARDEKSPSLCHFIPPRNAGILCPMSSRFIAA